MGKLANLILILFLLRSTTGFCQDSCSYSVSGLVLDIAENEPIPFANVMVSGSTKGATTDISGRFLIEGICMEEFDLIITYVGYKTTKHHHDSYHKNPTIMLAPDNQMLESIVVEGEYNATSMNTLKIDQLDPEVLAGNQSESLAQLAGNIAGLSMLSTGQNVMKPIIHGLHSNRVLIINNGVRHEFQNWGIEHAPEVDPSQVASLEVLKGAATVRYGPDALGGVILVNPAKLELYSGFKGTINSTLNSNGKSGDLALNLRNGWHKWVVAVQGSLTKQGDLKAPNYQLTNTGKMEYSFSTNIRYHIHKLDLEAYYSRFHQNLGILRGSVNGNLVDLAQAMISDVPQYTTEFSYDVNNPRQEVDHDLFKLKGVLTFSDQNFIFQYAYQKNHRLEYDVRRGANNDNPSINLELNTHSLDLDWNLPPLGSVTSIAGIQWIYQDNNNLPGTNTIPYIPNFNSTRLGIYTIEHFDMGDWLYELGLRYDFQFTFARGYDSRNEEFSSDLTFNQLTGSAGVKRTYKNFDIHANLGLAWRPPNVAELYSFGKHGASIEYGLWRYELTDDQVEIRVLGESDNPIKSEIGWKWLNNLTFQKGRDQFAITTYLNLIENYIYTRPAGIINTIRGAFPYFLYQQTNALLAGLDYTFERAIDKSIVLKSSGNYLWSKDIKNNDVFVEMPTTRISLSMEFSVCPDFLGKSSFEIGGTYHFRYFQAPDVINPEQFISETVDLQALTASNFDFMAAPPGYFLPTLKWRASKDRWSWQIQAFNLFNQTYKIYTDRLRYFADQQGRNFRVSLGYILN